MAIAQLKFPAVASIARQDFLGPFQERLRSEYPVLRGEREMQLVVTPTGPAASPTGGNLVWRMTSPHHKWRVSLSSTFVAVDTSEYTTRSDFLGRFREALMALHELVSPVQFDRLGVRYVNRIEATDLERLEVLVRPDLLGVLTVIRRGSVPAVAHSVCDSEFRFPDGVLRVRSGLLPPDTSLDLSIPPAQVQSWILDLDTSTEVVQDFEIEAVATRADQFADRAYAFFRWAVTDELLQSHGAESVNA